MILSGADEVISDFENFGFSGRKVIPSYLSLIGNSAVDLLKANTPVDTGELRDSWRIKEYGNNYVIVGVTPDQEEKLGYVVNGTKFIAPNNFVARVDSFINDMMEETIERLLINSHKFWTPVAGKANLAKIVGLTGVKYNRRRAFGRSTLTKPRTGRLSNRVRIGRRRRVGSVASTKRVTLG